MESSSQPQIIGKHNLANHSFLRAVFTAALKVLDYLEDDEIQAYALSSLVVSALSLPANEQLLVMNALAPKSSIAQKSYITGALVVLGPDENATPQKETVTPPQADENSSARPMNPDVGNLKREIFDALNHWKIVPDSYLDKQFGASFEKLSCSLNTFLSFQFSSQELNHSEGVVAIVGYEPSMKALTNKILEENGHRPFNINILSERFGYSLEEIRSKLKRKELSTFIQWNPYQTWALFDVQTSPSAIGKIKKCVALSQNGPVLLVDLFHCLFVGIIAENSYDEIDESARIFCAKKGLNDSGFYNYEFCKEKMAFLQKKAPESDLKRTPLYKVF